MWDQADRPVVALGHAFLKTSAPGATIQLFLDLGFRSIVTREDFAVLEMRGGTHIVLQAAQEGEELDAIGWDLMVDDIDQTHSDYSSKGLKVSTIRRGRIHDNFDLTLPDGRLLEVNNSHAGDRVV